LKIKGLLWPAGIIEKLLLKHDVQQFEVREVFEGRRRFRFVEAGDRTGEDLCSALGQTEVGRYLIVFFIYTEGQEALIVSARDMNASERKRYGRK